MIYKYMCANNYINKKNCFDDLLNVRKKKLIEIRKQGIAFPNNFHKDSISSQLCEKYSCKTNQELLKLKIVVNVAGRLISQRIMGKVSFFTLQDVGGCIQLYITSDVFLSKHAYKDSIKKWDIGDIIGVSGTLFKTRTGELSIYCNTIQLLTKSLRPIPDKFYGLNDQEIRYRKRYLDLIVNDRSKEIFKTRSFIIHEIRQFMVLNGFMEVETPMMHVIAGGAIARPFITYHNKLSMDMYLRIAPELYLKKLIVGGFEKIFEINRSFRNEGVSSKHNPEFTMMELYMAYANYNDVIILIQNLLRVLTKKVLNSNVVRYGDYDLNFENEFIRMTIKESIIYYLPEIGDKNIDEILTVTTIAESLGIQVHNSWTVYKIQMAIFEEIVEKKIIQPTIITGYPVEVSPLARRNNDNPMITDRFELFIAGKEIGNGFSELNDPEDQRERFLQQFSEKSECSDNNYMNWDEDYLVALEHGLPPTAGVGIGIDRLVMLLTNQHTIRDVIFFPTLRPK